MCVFEVDLYRFVCFSIAMLSGVLWATESFRPVRPDQPKRFCAEHGEWLRYAEMNEEWEEVTGYPGLRVYMPYATFRNVTGHDLYCGVHRAFLHWDAAQKLKNAIGELRRLRPGFGLLLFDAARPRHAQEQLHAVVRGTRYSRFVSNPHLGSMHSYGMAVDLTIVDANGIPLDMGTRYDSFEERSGARGEMAALAIGTLTKRQIAHRNLLRKIMKSAGFIGLSSEWWHFNADMSQEVRAKYQQLDQLMNSD